MPRFGSTFWLTMALGVGAGLADYLGGALLVRRSPSARALRYFVALGSGFMVAAVLLEMMPEGVAVNPHWAPVLIPGGILRGASAGAYAGAALPFWRGIA